MNLEFFTDLSELNSSDSYFDFRILLKIDYSDDGTYILLPGRKSSETIG